MIQYHRDLFWDPYHIISYRIVLYCTVLYCIALSCPVLSYLILSDLAKISTESQTDVSRHEFNHTEQWCTGLIKSNRPRYFSVSHKHGIRLSDLKFARCIARVIKVLLAEFQIRIMSHIATMNTWINALFAMQIKVCQLVVEPRYLTGCVIHAGHVSSIACFYH